MFGRFIESVAVARIIALALIFFALFVRVADPIPVQLVRNLTFDSFQRILPRTPEALPVAIIDIDDASIAEIGQWPWPRTRFAEMIDTLTSYGAVAIAFDVIFAEPDRLSPKAVAIDNEALPRGVSQALSQLPDNDDVLAEAFQRARVIVGQTSVRSAFHRATQSAEVQDVPHATMGPPPDGFILELPDLVQNLSVLEDAAAGRGMFSIRPDPDGVYRNLPMVMRAEGHLRLALAPEMLRVATGGAPFVLRSNEAGVDGVVLARQFVQTSADGTVRPYLTRSRQDRFIPAADVLNGTLKPAQVSGKLLFFGTSAVGLGDYRATPFGVSVPGVELHAQLLENLLTNTLLQRPNYAISVELTVTFLLCLLFVIVTPIMNAKFLAASSVAFLVTCGWGSFLLFQNERILLDASFPIVSALATIIFMSTTNYMREEKRRRDIRSAFGHYVSEDLVDAISDNPDGLQLGGETRELTLLFSDVRGFTPIAESFRDNPAGLTRLMNTFLNLQSNAILNERGTIDKFMGDAVMAFWNAPLPHEDHVRAACRAALLMRDGVEALNAKRQKEAQDTGTVFMEIRFGIGIATGSCMVGNMGSDTRFDYTAMGDPVNLASRLEGQSSTYGKTVIVAAETARRVGDEFALLELDLVRLKGKRQAEHIFALLGTSELRKNAPFQQIWSRNAEMLHAYRSREWQTAKNLLAVMAKLNADHDFGLDRHLANYRERIDAFEMAPPPDDWDGVHDATSK
ncbi:adenylate/guanylate cyclase domain-containing protein [Shimia sp. R10_1]|uniref:CHASE2 domain-containing protein n=1 Tax=Shimia sp. R10_1 TaxID=2821095 RepID=UPI001ADA8749|nr:adenylate/guanylate cyclase domain-containing protein [Shimia sp. R10_1]MBO9475518.1 adenylate/guanylate cyclase domain-containing protein [Shimia sp. R10_1]